jgi:hypothetical protein
MAPNQRGGESAGTKFIKLTSGTDFSETLGPTRAICVGTAGTATFVDLEGNTATNFPLKEGDHPYRITKITLGSAADVWGIW